MKSDFDNIWGTKPYSKISSDNISRYHQLKSAKLITDILGLEFPYTHPETNEVISSLDELIGYLKKNKSKIFPY